jgi:hypothetical protein
MICCICEKNMKSSVCFVEIKLLEPVACLYTADCFMPPISVARGWACHEGSWNIRHSVSSRTLQITKVLHVTLAKGNNLSLTGCIINSLNPVLYQQNKEVTNQFLFLLVRSVCPGKWRSLGLIHLFVCDWHLPELTIVNYLWKKLGI